MNRLKINLNMDDLRGLIDRLSSREKMLALATLAGFVAFVGIAVGIGINLSLNKLADRLNTKRDNYEQIMTMKARFTEARSVVEGIQNEIKNNRNTLTQDIGGLATENQIEIAQISQSKGAVDKKSKIREESVKVELRKVQLPPLLFFMEKIEKRNKLFFIRNVEMKRRFDNKAEIDVTFTVSTLVTAEDEG